MLDSGNFIVLQCMLRSSIDYTSPTIGLSEKAFRPSWNFGLMLFTRSTIFLSLERKNQKISLSISINENHLLIFFLSIIHKERISFSCGKPLNFFGLSYQQTVKFLHLKPRIRMAFQVNCWYCLHKETISQKFTTFLM